MGRAANRKVHDRRAVELLRAWEKSGGADRDRKLVAEVRKHQAQRTRVLCEIVGLAVAAAVCLLMAVTW